jgi:hypothetical protein
MAMRMPRRSAASDRTPILVFQQLLQLIDALLRFGERIVAAFRYQHGHRGETVEGLAELRPDLFELLVVLGIQQAGQELGIALARLALWKTLVFCGAIPGTHHFRQLPRGGAIEIVVRKLRHPIARQRLWRRRSIWHVARADVHKMRPPELGAARRFPKLPEFAELVRYGRAKSQGADARRDLDSFAS